jgi:hypothetical protein
MEISIIIAGNESFVEGDIMFRVICETKILDNEGADNLFVIATKC